MFPGFYFEQTRMLNTSNGIAICSRGTTRKELHTIALNAKDKSATSIFITNPKIEIDRETLPDIKTIVTLPSIRSLTLENFRGDEWFTFFTFLISSNLVELSLNGAYTSFGDRHLGMLCRALKGNRKLVKLDLGFTSISLTPSKYLTHDDIMCLHHIETLSFELEAAAREEIVTEDTLIGALFKLDSLTDLSLRCRDLDENEFFEIFNGMKKNTTIAVLNISENEIPEECYDSFFEMLRTPLLPLSHLSFDPSLDDPFYNSLTQALEYNTTITHLNLFYGGEAGWGSTGDVDLLYGRKMFDPRTPEEHLIADEQERNVVKCEALCENVQRKRGVHYTTN